ncbi:hypothetical protein [Teredinibacter turnerae]|uniref:hypothetical protein n=1 Tax=Teredinibacter turnerae TaxID=2426 RepID=UPI00036A050A|nr:hypothetical protein [Teredinibacter turnerae]
MDIKTIASIAGVLGFFISVATFVLTRVERRKRLIIELYKGSLKDIPGDFTLDEDNEYEEIVKIRVTNIGGKPVILKPESFYFQWNKKIIDTTQCDWLGIKELPSPLKIGESCEVGIFVESLIHLWKLDEFEKSCGDQLDKTRIPLEIGVLDHSGTRFLSKRFSYFVAVGEVERKC